MVANGHKILKLETFKENIQAVGFYKKTIGK